MLYAPSPYSSRTEVSVYEQDAYPTIDVTSSIPSGNTSPQSRYNEVHSLNSLSNSPILNQLSLLDTEYNLETNPIPSTNDEDDFYFFSQLQNDAALLQQYNNSNNNNDNRSIMNDNNHSNNNSSDNSNNNNITDNSTNYYLSYDNTIEENNNHNEFNDNSLLHDEDDDEEEEEESNAYITNNNHYQYLQHPYPFDPSEQSLYSSPTITDDDFETANRAFHATINKFSRQTYPEHRRRAPYSFLENWHLHSMYSKSQQILLGIAHVRPMVLLSGDDFMFTPPLLQQEDDEEYIDDNNLHHDHQQLHYLDQPTQMDWIDGEEMFEDDGDILDDGIVIMSAPDPPTIPHDHYLLNNQLHKKMNMIDDLDDDDLVDNITNNNNNNNNINSNNNNNNNTITHSTTLLNENAWMKNKVGGPLLQQHQQQQQQYQVNTLQDDDDTPLTESKTLYSSGGFSSELVHWYRSNDRGRPPSTIMEVSLEDDQNENNNTDHVEYEITEVESDIDNNYYPSKIKNQSYINVETEYIDKDNDDHHQYNNSSTQLITSDKLKPLDYHHTHTTYQSLTDIVPSIPSSSPSITIHSDIKNDEQKSNQYGLIYEYNNGQLASTSTTHYSESQTNNHHIGFANQLMATTELVLNIASEYHSKSAFVDTTTIENNNKQEMSFIQCLLNIWQVLFLTAELALTMLWGQQQPLIMDNNTKSNRRHYNNNEVTEHILPF